MRTILKQCGALFLALLVGGGVWVWLWIPRPLWRQPLQQEGILAPHFRDNQLVATTHVAVNELRTPFVSFWNVETGRLVRRVEVKLPAAAGVVCSLVLQEDAKDVVVATSTEPPSPIGPPAPNRWYVYDLETGRVLQGPIEKAEFTYGPVALQEFIQVSPRGSYFFKLYPGTGVLGGYRRAEIMTLKTGERIGTLEPEPGKAMDGFLFSPDETKLAVLWGLDLPKSSGYPDGFSSRFSVTVHDLPSGQVQTEIPTVGHYQVSLKRWQGETLWVKESLPGDISSGAFKGFAVSGATWREEPADPLLRGKREGGDEYGCIDFGPDWVAYFHVVPRFATPPPTDWVDKVRDGLRSWVSKPKGNGADFYLLVLNRPDGSLRYRSREPVLAGVLTPDGRRRVCLGQEAGSNGLRIEVWDLEPPLRWPYVVGAGVVTYGLWFGWWKYRGRQRAVKRLVV